MPLTKYIILNIKKSICFFLKLFYIFPVNEKQILFSAYRGTQYSCNPKAIYEALQRLYPNKFSCVWVLDDKNIAPSDTICVKRFTLKYYYYMLTSKVLVDNWGFSAFVPFRRTQLKINTWHGGGAYKKGGIDIKQTSFTIKQLQIEGQNTDVLLSSCEKFSEVFPKSHFISTKKVWEIGMPRNDMLINPPPLKKDNIRKVLKIPKEYKLLLYAPTYRGDFNNASALNVQLDFSSCIKALSQKFGGNWVVGMRTHYADKITLTANKVLDFSLYQDMQELLLAADVLITDYSSVIWDYSLMFKPCFIFAPDKLDYEKSVDFYTPMADWPFPLSHNNSELIENILNFKSDEYFNAVQLHHKSMGIKESGSAAEQTSKLIFEVCYANKT